MKALLLALTLICSVAAVSAQKEERIPRYFSDPIIVDSSSTMMFVIRYNTELFGSNKISLWDDYYANIIFYDFKSDSSKRLFSEDTFIKAFPPSNSNMLFSNDRAPRRETGTSSWIFYFVKPFDYDNSGRIDSRDPSVLYVSDRHGNNLKAITPSNENALSIQLFEKQQIALIKMQRDYDGDKNFEYSDLDYYYVKLDLQTLSLGNKIEVR